MSLFLNDSISSSMDFFQSPPSVESIASLTVLGSSSMEDNAKAKKKSDGLYLLGCFLTRPNIPTTGVYTSTSSSDSVDTFES